MSLNFTSELPAYRDRLKLGTAIIDNDSYPYYAFLMGHFIDQVADLDILFEFMEVAFRLQKDKMINQIIFIQLIATLRKYPKNAKKMVRMMEGIRERGGADVIRELQNFCKECEESKKVPEDLNGSFGTEQLEEEKPDLSEIPHSDKNHRNKGQQQFQALQNQYFRQKQLAQQDELYAAKLQQQMDKEPNNKMDIEDDTPCEICYCNLYDMEFMLLETCGHMFHKQCLVETFKGNIMSNNFPLRCPNDGCTKEILERDVKEILPKVLFEKYQDHTLKSYAEMHGDSVSWCPTANCGYMFFFEKQDNERFECLQCRKDYCLNCRVEWHKDMTCKQYKVNSTVTQQDEQFMAFVKGKKFKQCPKCKYWVQKNDGCDHMTCKCKFQFCYKCGGVYMKCQCVQLAKQEQARRQAVAAERKRKKQERLRKAQEKAAKQAQKFEGERQTRGRKPRSTKKR